MWILGLKGLSHSFLKHQVGSLSFEEETGKNPLRNKLFYTVVLLQTFVLINCICQVFLFCFTHVPLKRIADMYIFGHGHAIHSFIYSFIYLPLTRNTTTVYRNTLKTIYNIPTKLFTRSDVVKARKPI